MITRLQFVIMCRVEQGLPAFTRPLAPKTHPNILKRRREALVDLYDRGLIVSVKKTSSRHGPRLTLTGKRTLNWVRHGGEDIGSPYGVKGEPGYVARAVQVHLLRKALKSGEPIGSRYD